jgi:hypothetical protein
MDRPRYTDYKLLKPGGFISHGLGILGSLMMILLLLYTVRKRTHIFGKAGALSHWLDIHIFFGTIGPIFIILHSTLKLNGIVSVSFWSMVLVAFSGFLGRYLYIQIPRSIKGNELTKDEIQQQVELLGKKLQKIYKMDEKEIILLMNVMIGSKKNGLFRMVFEDISRFFRLFTIKKQLKYRFRIPKEKVKELLKILTQKTLLDRRIALLSKIHKLFHYWHVFHKPFAVIMYIIMFVHISVVIWLGYAWIL